MRIALAMLLVAGCARFTQQPPPAVSVAPLPPAPPPGPPAPPPPADPAATPKLTAEQLADLCEVVPVQDEQGKPRPSLARIDCEPPRGTPGEDSLAGALFAASVAGVARNRIWFVYRISPAEQVPAGQFRIAVVYLENAQAYQQAKAANGDSAVVYTTAPEVMPAEAFLMQRSTAETAPVVGTAPAHAPSVNHDPFDTAGDDDP
jgi:hypothetical protein